MSFKADPAFDKKNHNFMQKCFYLLSQIKLKNHDLWEKLNTQFANLKTEESHDFYNLLVMEYKNVAHLESNPNPSAATAVVKKKPEVKKVAPPVKTVKKVVKKKVAKKVEKKEPVKKVAKKTEKKSAKKVAKKVAKKASKKK
jgi:hypothetical protein